TVVERYAYDPYGAFTIYDAGWNVRSGSSFAWVHLHQGLRYDSVSATYENRGRVYNPSLSRFLHNDPMGFGAGDVNLYRAEGDSPTGGLDPSGLDTWGDFKAGMGVLWNSVTNVGIGAAKTAAGIPGAIKETGLVIYDGARLIGGKMPTMAANLAFGTEVWEP